MKLCQVIESVLACLSRRFLVLCNLSSVCENTESRSRIFTAVSQTARYDGNFADREFFGRSAVIIIGNSGFFKILREDGSGLFGARSVAEIRGAAEFLFGGMLRLFGQPSADRTAGRFGRDPPFRFFERF